MAPLGLSELNGWLHSRENTVPADSDYQLMISKTVLRAHFTNDSWANNPNLMENFALHDYCGSIGQLKMLKSKFDQNEFSLLVR